MTRQESAKINGARSQGPTTPQGKARSSQNAIKHGMNAKAIVLAHESQQDFDRLLADFEARFQPAGEVEHDLVLSLAAARWRLRRIQAMENAVFEQEIRRVSNDPDNPVDRDTAIQIAYANLAAGPALHRLHKYEVRLQRDYVTCERLLLELQEARRQNEPEIDRARAEFDAIVQQIREETGELPHSEPDDHDDLHPMPGRTEEWSSADRL